MVLLVVFLEGEGVFFVEEDELDGGVFIVEVGKGVG